MLAKKLDDFREDKSEITYAYVKVASDTEKQAGGSHVVKHTDGSTYLIYFMSQSIKSIIEDSNMLKGRRGVHKFCRIEKTIDLNRKHVFKIIDFFDPEIKD